MHACVPFEKAKRRKSSVVIFVPHTHLHKSDEGKDHTEQPTIDRDVKELYLTLFDMVRFELHAH